MYQEYVFWYQKSHEIDFEKYCPCMLPVKELVTCEALLFSYTLLHTEIDCGIEIWHTKLTRHPYIYKRAIFKISTRMFKIHSHTPTRFLTYMATSVLHGITFQSYKSSAISLTGLFCFAAATIPSPRGPQPDTTTTSLNWMLPVCNEIQRHIICIYSSYTILQYNINYNLGVIRSI